jgi:splicing factor 3B subunit 1
MSFLFSSPICGCKNAKVASVAPLLIAITIVVETCGPFTCIPAILNEYRTAELNVRTGCLKALTFVFECTGPQSAYYCDSVVTMLEDALTDRDLVHRQTASVIMKHIALGVAGNHEVLFVSVERLPTLYVLVVHSISCIADVIITVSSLGPAAAFHVTLR